MDQPGSLDQLLSSTYRLERQLGRKGMAVVYLVHDAKQGYRWIKH